MSSNVLQTYGPQKTANYLAYKGASITGTILESVILPTLEILVLTQEEDGYSIHLIGASEFIPQIALETNLTEREKPFALGYYAAVLMNPGKPANFVLEPSHNW